MDEMIWVIEPAEILVYGGGVEYDYKGIKVVYYGNHVTDKLKMTKGRIYVEVGCGDLLRIISFDKTNKWNHVIEREKIPMNGMYITAIFMLNTVKTNMTA